MTTTDEPDDFDDFESEGRTTRRGLFSSFRRRFDDAQSDPAEPPDSSAFWADEIFDEEPPYWVEPELSNEELVADVEEVREETGMHIWWLGHSGFLVAVGGDAIVLDPYLSDTLTAGEENLDGLAERITGIVVEPGMLSFAQVVTSSHAHRAHLDDETLRPMLAGEAALVCAAGSELVTLERAGRQPDAALAAFENATFGAFEIEAVPAHHDGAPEAVGYVVRHGAYSLYHAGDTRRVQGIAEAVAQYGVDVAFVPISGKRGTMDGTDAARLAYESGAQIAIPCGFEMFRSNTASPSRFIAECVRLGQEYRLPRPGERITIDYGF